MPPLDWPCRPGVRLFNILLNGVAMEGSPWDGKARILFQICRTPSRGSDMPPLATGAGQAPEHPRLPDLQVSLYK